MPGSVCLSPLLRIPCVRVYDLYETACAFNGQIIIVSSIFHASRKKDQIVNTFLLARQCFVSSYRWTNTRLGHYRYLRCRQKSAFYQLLTLARLLPLGQLEPRLCLLRKSIDLGVLILCWQHECNWSLCTSTHKGTVRSELVRQTGALFCDVL